MHKRFKYSLDPGSKKFYCPNCGKKRFVRYIDNESNLYLSSTFGRCDREQNCSYFKKPDSIQSGLSNNKTEKSRIQNYDCINKKHLVKTFKSEWEKENNFISSLNHILDKNSIQRVVDEYFISTCEYWNKKATIFWQIDENVKIRSGQVILYDKNGKRVKNPFNHITWIHSVLIKRGELKDFKLNQCLFGLHLINEYPDKKIAIVEAPKTACIMSAIYPKYLWMATCGISNLNSELFVPLKSKKIILYPDLGAYEKWNNKVNTIKKSGYNIKVSTLLETVCKGFPKGLDIADFFIETL